VSHPPQQPAPDHQPAPPSAPDNETPASADPPPPADAVTDIAAPDLTEPPGADAPERTSEAAAAGVPDGSSAFAVAGAPQDAASGDEQEPVRRRRRWPVVVAVGVVLALVLSGAGYAAARAWYGWGISEPEAVVPADVALFARVDLAPGYREKLQLAGLVKKFPSGKASGPEKAVDGLEKPFFADTGLDFAKDIKPWFADRAGFALWSRDGKPVPVLVLASSDNAKAKQALAKARIGDKPVGYALLDGYALVVPASDGGQAAAQAAAAAAHKQPLERDSRYHSAVSRLRDNSVGYAYADLAALAKIGRGALSDVLDATPQDALGDLTSTPDPKAIDTALASLTGTVVAGASVTDNGVEILSRATGMPAASAAAGGAVDVRDALGKAPADSVVALSADGAQSGNAAATKAVSGTISALLYTFVAGSLFTDGDSLGVVPGGDLFDDPTVAIDPETGMPTGLDPKQQAELQRQLEQFQKEMQARLAKVTDAATAIATARVLTLAVTGADSGRLDVQPRDSSATGTLTGLIDLLGGNVSAERVGDGVRFSLGDKDTSAGTLRDSAQFRDALGKVPGTTVVAGYVDVPRLLEVAKADGNTRTQWGPVRAVGLVVGQSGSETTTIVRIIVK
jgi:Protein of unknown function (DUF3352)